MNYNPILSNMDKIDLKNLCDQIITESEILKSLKSLHNGQTPGTDGFPPEFYKYFWIDTKTLLVNSIAINEKLMMVKTFGSQRIFIMHYRQCK